MSGDNAGIMAAIVFVSSVRGDTVSAVDMSQVIMSNSNTLKAKNEGLTQQDLDWQEARRKRKVRKLDFEVR